MESQDYQETKDQLIEQAAREISDIQRTGQMFRAQIDIAKERALHTIEEDEARKRLHDSAAAEKRMELLRKMANAAKAGDSVEMQRIQNLLKEDKS